MPVLRKKARLVTPSLKCPQFQAVMQAAGALTQSIHLL